jgi:hypothetical protein
VDYRSFFEVGDVSQFEHEIDRQFHSWLLSKDLRVEELAVGRQMIALRAWSGGWWTHSTQRTEWRGCVVSR